jgi:hypothetical protein
MVSNLTLAVRCGGCLARPAETQALTSDAMAELGFRTPFDELHERVIGTQFETPACRREAGLKEDGARAGGVFEQAGLVWNSTPYMIKALSLPVILRLPALANTAGIRPTDCLAIACHDSQYWHLKSRAKFTNVCHAFTRYPADRSKEPITLTFMQ